MVAPNVESLTTYFFYPEVEGFMLYLFLFDELVKKLFSSVGGYILQGRVLKCLELIKDLSLISRSTTNGGGGTGSGTGTGTGIGTGSAPSLSSVPQSPVGVLDAACLSCKSDELTVGSCANSSSISHTSPDTKRRKPDGII